MSTYVVARLFFGPPTLAYSLSRLWRRTPLPAPVRCPHRRPFGVPSLHPGLSRKDMKLTRKDKGNHRGDAPFPHSTPYYSPSIVDRPANSAGRDSRHTSSALDSLSFFYLSASFPSILRTHSDASLCASSSVASGTLLPTCVVAMKSRIAWLHLSSAKGSRILKRSLPLLVSFLASAYKIFCCPFHLRQFLKRYSRVWCLYWHHPHLAFFVHSKYYPVRVTMSSL